MHNCSSSCILACAHAAGGGVQNLARSSPPLCVAPDSLQRFMARVPKAELHIHLEGTLEAEMLLDIAGIHVPLLETTL